MQAAATGTGVKGPASRWLQPGVNVNGRLPFKVCHQQFLSAFKDCYWLAIEEQCQLGFQVTPNLFQGPHQRLGCADNSFAQICCRAVHQRYYLGPAVVCRNLCENVPVWPCGDTNGDVGSYG